MPKLKWEPGMYCDRCNNTGEIECYCGGDLCVCGRQEITCPRCDGLSADPYYGQDWDDDDEAEGTPT
jgi:hypothetical protein